jgi:2-polyprenyl-3-methyl-5-hydroxy-6-metoxy-1,4-benzoquinol methylase
MASGPELFKDYFDSAYKHGNIFSKQQYDKASESFESRYSDVMPRDKQANILDLGAGGGQFLYYLRKKGYSNYMGIDISAQQVEFCKKNVTDRVLEADAFQFLKGKQVTYDAIVANDVLEHIRKEDLPALLNMVKSCLKKKGVFIARVPNMSNPFSLNSRYCDFTHETGFTPRSLYQVLWLSGFRDIAILPPEKIRVRSLRNLVRRSLVALLRFVIRSSYYIQSFSVPDNLDKNIVVAAKK